MAIYHCSMKPVSRGAGRSAVAAIAYRTASRIINERENVLYDFTAKRGVAHCEIVFPDGIDASWARDRSTLWNAAEAAERRLDARVAREFEIALPHELNDAQRLSLTRAFATDLANRFGTAVDFAIHVPVNVQHNVHARASVSVSDRAPSDKSDHHERHDARNVHAHVMMTTRVVTATGFAGKSLIERENGWLLANDLPTSHMQMREVRQMLADHINRHLLQAGFDRRVDHRSHPDRGLDLEPTGHVGVHASQMKQRGMDVSRSRIDAAAAHRNAELIRRRPDQILSLITGERSVFDRHHIARTLSRYITDTEALHRAFAAVMASPQLVELKAEQNGELARYSTREMIETEHRMAALATHMAKTSRHPVRDVTVERAIAQQNEQLAGAGLSDEQQDAIRHISGPQQIAAVIGFAGAGKSTMLSAARRSWELQGYRVHGAALAGKAAAGLTASSGIASRTLAAWELGWTNGKGMLGGDDILVIDEAGMIGSRQLARFVNEAQTRGAKLVLVGDHEQLQAIGAGSPFRALVERIGAVELTDIRRQKQDWQRLASRAFATHRTADGLFHYAERGAIIFAADRDAARADLVRDYVADRINNPAGSRLALAHRRVDVRAINDAIRSALQAEGLLAKGTSPASDRINIASHKNAPHPNSEIIYETVNGARAFAAGDRMVLLQNNRDLGVKNGMLATVETVGKNAVHIRLDGSSGSHDAGRILSIPVGDYQAFDHGYATTIHKAQGATVDRTFLMASTTMDRHLTYVAMTRHRHQATLYAGRDQLKDMKNLTASMSRSGLKETTLDYTNAFAERRGLGEDMGRVDDAKVIVERQQHELRQSTDASQDSRLTHPAGVAGGSLQSRPPIGEHNDLHHPHQKNPPPLIPAITHHDRSIDVVARDRALPHLERDMQAVRSVGANVHLDPFTVAATLQKHIMEGTAEPAILARAVRERPEQFGPLRGSAGIFGDSRERKQALHSARALGNHVEAAADTWARQLNLARDTETWAREKCDVVEVPGISKRSEALLKAFDALPHQDRPDALRQMAGSEDGQRALQEAAAVVRALEQRFGKADLRNIETPTLRLAADTVHNIERVKNIAALAERLHRAELAREHTLSRSITKGLGLLL